MHWWTLELMQASIGCWWAPLSICAKNSRGRPTPPGCQRSEGERTTERSLRRPWRARQQHEPSGARLGGVVGGVVGGVMGGEGGGWWRMLGSLLRVGEEVDRGTAGEESAAETPTL